MNGKLKNVGEGHASLLSTHIDHGRSMNRIWKNDDISREMQVAFGQYMDLERTMDTIKLNAIELNYTNHSMIDT